MDEKYTGCNIVESVVTTSPLPEQKKSKKHAARVTKSHLLARLIISVLVIGVFLVLHYCPTLPYASAVTDVFKKVFCYDVFGRSAFGATIFG